MDHLPQENKFFVFGFEESYGYLAGACARQGCCDRQPLVAQVGVLQDPGLTLVDRLQNFLRSTATISRISFLIPLPPV